MGPVGRTYLIGRFLCPFWVDLRCIPLLPLCSSPRYQRNIPYTKIRGFGKKLKLKALYPVFLNNMLTDTKLRHSFSGANSLEFMRIKAFSAIVIPKPFRSSPNAALGLNVFIEFPTYSVLSMMRHLGSAPLHIIIPRNDRSFKYQTKQKPGWNDILVFKLQDKK